MGAGSAKGVQPEDHEDEVDSFSSTSSDHWGAEEDPPAPPPAPAAAPPKPKPKPPKPQPPAVDPATAGTSSVAQIENGDAEEKKEKPKKKTFGFTLHRNEQQNTDKVEDVANDSSDDEGQKERKGGDKGEKGKDKKGFRLFGWRKDDKNKEKDEALDEDISDLEKTFDSLGIVGKNMWGGADATAPQQEAARDDMVLSPMRKRKNVRGRGGVKGVNGAANGGGSDGSLTSKRTFKFSWETDKQKSPPRDEEDEWEYKAVVIEGFDIEKFRKANLKESVFDSNSLPNVVGGEEDPGANHTSSPLRYDQTEQYILASIEREFTTN